MRDYRESTARDEAAKRPTIGDRPQRRIETGPEIGRISNTYLLQRIHRRPRRRPATPSGPARPGQSTRVRAPTGAKPRWADPRSLPSASHHASRVRRPGAHDRQSRGWAALSTLPASGCSRKSGAGFLQRQRLASPSRPAGPLLRVEYVFTRFWSGSSQNASAQNDGQRRRLPGCPIASSPHTRCSP